VSENGKEQCDTTHVWGESTAEKHLRLVGEAAWWGWACHCVEYATVALSKS